VNKPGNQVQVERASSALADVDIAGWTLRFDLLSDPNPLEILLGPLMVHLAADIARRRRADELSHQSQSPKDAPTPQPASQSAAGPQ
jgi:hypothetical protein